MTERRFYVRPEDASADRLVLRDDEAHHARRVLRLDVGARVTAFDGRGSVWHARIVEMTKQHAVLEPEEALAREPEPRPRVTLAQGIVKGDRMDWIVQKATELGAARLLPLRADRSEVRLDEDRAGRRAERWRRITIEAAKQSERAWLPEIAAPLSLRDALAALDGPAVALLERSDRPARDALAALGPVGRVTVFVGPEGGWTAEERDALRAAGVAGLSLGRHVLRAETAALAAIVAVTLFVEAS